MAATGSSTHNNMGALIPTMKMTAIGGKRKKMNIMTPAGTSRSMVSTSLEHLQIGVVLKLIGLIFQWHILSCTSM